MSALDVSTIVHFLILGTQVTNGWDALLQKMTKDLSCSEAAATHLCNVDDETLSHSVGLHQETLVLNQSLLDDVKEAVSTILSTCQLNQPASRIILHHWN